MHTIRQGRNRAITEAASPSRSNGMSNGGNGDGGKRPALRSVARRTIVAQKPFARQRAVPGVVGVPAPEKAKGKKRGALILPIKLASDRNEDAAEENSSAPDLSDADDGDRAAEGGGGGTTRPARRTLMNLKTIAQMQSAAPGAPPTSPDQAREKKRKAPTKKTQEPEPEEDRLEFKTLFIIFLSSVYFVVQARRAWLREHPSHREPELIIFSGPMAPSPPDLRWLVAAQTVVIAAMAVKLRRQKSPPTSSEYAMRGADLDVPSEVFVRTLGDGPPVARTEEGAPVTKTVDGTPVEDIGTSSKSCLRKSSYTDKALASSPGVRFVPQPPRPGMTRRRSSNLSDCSLESAKDRVLFAVVHRARSRLARKMSKRRRLAEFIQTEDMKAQEATLADAEDLVARLGKVISNIEALEAEGEIDAEEARELLERARDAARGATRALIAEEGLGWTDH